VLRFLRFFVAMILICSFAACNRDKASIIPSVNINKKSAEMGTPIEVTYSFSTKSNYVALSKEMTVFVHFIDPRGNRRFQDDHVPPKPISEWRPDGNYNYTRTVFVPKNIPAGEYSVVAGIYSPRKEERIVLQAKPYGNRSYEMGILLIEIPPQGPVAQFMYQDAKGQRLTIYVSSQKGETADTAFRFAQEGRVSVFYWIDRHYGYALSGEMGREALLSLANVVYKQLNP